MADCSKAKDQQLKNPGHPGESWGDAGVDVGRAQTTAALVRRD